MNNKEEQKEEMVSLTEAAAVAGVSTGIFALYVQFSPKMGKLYRKVAIWIAIKKHWL